MKTQKLNDTSLLIARLILGLVIVGHGSQKLFGWFGGYGFDGTMQFFTTMVGLPYILALLIILAESLGMVALFLGLGTRLFSVALVPIMVGAIITTHAQFGFFMNWFGGQAGEGFEFHLLVIALAAVLGLNGAGAYSIDAYVQTRLKGTKGAFSLLVS